MVKQICQFFAGGLLVLALTGSEARANFIEAAWHYDWLAAPPEIVIDSATHTSITLTNEPASPTRIGGSNVVATNIITNSTSATPISFSNVPYNLTLKITDDQTPAPNNFAILNFSGRLTGSISQFGSLMTNLFTPPVQNFGPFMIGQNTYSVTLDSFVAPDGPGASKKGAIGATILAVGHEGTSPPTDDTPEPSTLMLSALGLCSLGAASWRRLRGKPAGN